MKNTETAQALNKEQIHDTLIAPLMGQVLGICEKHGIAMIAQFAIPTPDDADLVSSSMLPDESGNNPYRHLVASHFLDMPD